MMARPRTVLFCLPLLCCLAAAPSVAGAAGEGAVPDAAAALDETGRTVNLDFNNVDVSALIKFFSEITGKNFIVDQRVTGKISAYSPTPIPLDDAYQVFLTIMEMNRFRVVQSGALYRILPDADARAAASTDDDSPMPAELVTRVIPLYQSSAEELGKHLTQMLGDQGVVAAYAPTNTLIVTTSAELMGKVLAVTGKVDQGGNQPSFRSFSLQHANAQATAEKIDRMLQSRSKRGEAVGQNNFAVVEGDDRTGSVVVVADPESMRIVERSIESFDRPTTPGKGDMRVIPLKFASAEDLAAILSELVANQSPRTATSGSTSSETNAEGQTERTLVSEVSVVADPASNSLLVAASPRDFDTIRELVAQLDVERRQVYVEAMIVEVSTETIRAMGINWSAGATDRVGARDYLIFGGSRPGSASFGVESMGDTALLTPPSGGSLGIIAAPLSFAGLDFSNLNVLANFMRTDSRFHILATPQLMTLDNEEATVVVAENIPFLTQTAEGTSTTDRIVQSVEYRDVGITLKIRPQVSSNGSIKLSVQQIVSRISSQGINSGGQILAMPSTRRREVNTRVILENGQTLVIAGLIAKDMNGTTVKVPGLGDIPGLGWLFKAEDDTVVDTNLLLFLTPRVILTREDARSLEAEKRRIFHRIETGSDGRVSSASLPMRTMPPRLEQAR